MKEYPKIDMLLYVALTQIRTMYNEALSIRELVDGDWVVATSKNIILLSASTKEELLKEIREYVKYQA